MLSVPGDSPSQAQRTPDVLVQLTVTLGLFPLLLGALMLIHKRRPLESTYFPFEPSKRRITQSSYVKWMKLTWNSTIEDILQECGADGALIFCAIEFMIHFFAVCAVLGILVIFPVHAVYGVPRNQDEDRTDLFTIENIPSGSNILAVHMLATWLIAFAFYWLLHRTYFRVLAIKNRYMLLTGPSARTVLVEGVPSSMGDRQLRDYFNSLSIGTVEKVVVVRQCAELQKALARRWKWLQCVETIANSIPDTAQRLLETHPRTSTVPSQSSLSEPNSPTSSSHTTPLLPVHDIYSSSEHLFGELIEDIRWFRMTREQKLIYAYDRFMEADARVHDLRHDFRSISKRTPTAYVMFSHPVSESIATQTLVHGSITSLRCVRAPPPSDVQFDHLYIDPAISIMRTVIVAVAIFFLIFSWAIPIGFFSSLLSLDKLEGIFPWVAPILQYNSKLYALVKGLLPTLAVTIFLSLLPIILEVLASIRAFKSYSDANMFVFTTYFYFQLFNVILVFSIAGTIFESLQEIINSPSKVPELLARSLPRVSPFFVNLMMLHAFVLLPVLLLQIGTALVNGLLMRPRTPREKLAAAKRVTWPFYEFSSTVLMFIIGLVYSLVCPIILPLSLTYQCIAWFAWRYRLLYQVKVGETHGMVWVELVRMLHYGLTIFILLMFGILSLKKFYWASLGLVPLLGVNALGWWWLRFMERRVLNVPLDVWRSWSGDSYIEEELCLGTGDDGLPPSTVTTSCQGVVGVEHPPRSLGYDNPLLLGSLPVPWVAGSPAPTPRDPGLVTNHVATADVHNAQASANQPSMPSLHSANMDPVPTLSTDPNVPPPVPISDFSNDWK